MVSCRKKSKLRGLTIIDNEVVEAPVAGMLDLAQVLQLAVNRFNKGFFLSNIRSWSSIRAFFMFFLIFVTKCTPSTKSFPKMRLWKSMLLSSSRSSTFPKG
jgi:hypothetical protein